jgi:hypothetical protein
MSRVELGDIKKPKIKPKVKTVEQPKVKKKIKPKVKKKIKPKVKTVEQPKVKTVEQPKVKKKINKNLDKKTVKVKKKKTQKLDISSGKDLIAEGNAILERMSENIFDENRIYLDQYKHMFQKLAAMSEIAEHQYFAKKQSRDIYALMKLYDQMREVIADLKALQNVGQYIDAVMDDVIEPFAKTAIQALLDLISSTNAYSKRNLDPEFSKLLEEQLKSFGKIGGIMLQEGYDAAVENTRRILEG